MTNEKPFSDKNDVKEIPGKNERGVFEISVEPEDEQKVEAGVEKALKSLEGKPER